MLEANDLDFNWILLLMFSFIIVHIVYSLLEHIRYIHMGWKEMWIRGL